MIAIILTCDMYLPLTDHMIFSYQKVWPTNPFMFRVPYYDNSEYVHNLREKYGSKIELMQTKACKVDYPCTSVGVENNKETKVSLIKPTVLYLLEDLHDDEWIFWCMDDRYLIDVLECKVNEIIRWIKGIDDTSISGILLNRFGNMYEEKNLYPENIIKDTHNNVYIQRRNYKRIWNPQFLRVKVLRYLFERFPDRPFVAKEMDHFKNEIGIPREQKLFVSAANYLIVGESTSRGKLTKNCADSMINHGFRLPQKFEIGDAFIIQGEFVSRFNLIKNKFVNFITANCLSDSIRPKKNK